MTHSVEIRNRLPKMEEIQRGDGRPARMRASVVTVKADDAYGFPHLSVIVEGAGIRKDGHLAKARTSAFVLLPSLPSSTYGDVSVRVFGPTNQQLILDMADRADRALRVLTGDAGGDES